MEQAAASHLEKALVTGFLAIAAAEPFRFIGYLSGHAVDDDIDTGLKQIIWALAYGLAAIPCVIHLPRILWLWGQNRALAALLVLVAASLGWSVAPGATVPLVASALGSALLASYLAVRFTPLELTRMVVLALGLSAVASLLAVMLVPDYAVMTGPLHDGRWRGVTGQKNVLGRWMAAGLCLSVLAMVHTPGWQRRLYMAIAGVCTFLLVMAQSATAYVLLLVTATGWLFCRLWLRRGAPASRTYAGLVWVGLFGLAGLSLLALGYEQMLGLAGRDISLTTRTQLWQGVLAAVSARPLLGYGYSAFWQDPALMMSYLAGYLPWQAPHAHNGWLELLLGLGVTGTLLMAVSFIVTGWRALLALRAGAEPPVALGVVILLLTLALNMTEVTLVRGANLLWLCYLYVALRLPVSLFRPPSP